MVHRVTLGRFDPERPYAFTRDLRISGRRVKAGAKVDAGKLKLSRARMRQLYERRRITPTDDRPPDTPGNRIRQRPRPSAAAIKAAKLLKIAIGSVKGTGKNGNTTVKDVKAAADARKAEQRETEETG